MSGNADILAIRWGRMLGLGRCGVRVMGLGG